MDALFADLRVIDAASFLAAPAAATILADFGADVVKIEPLTGDQHRTIAAGHAADWSWQLTARSKRGLAMDISTHDGYQTLIEMVRQADVFIVNFSAQQLEKFNLQWDTLKAINPKLIFAQVSGFGLLGEEANRKAFDLTGWFARSGIMDMLHEKDIPPSIPARGVGDHATSMTLYAGILTALMRRQKTGEGSMVSTSLAACGAWANGLNLQGAIAGVDDAARRDKEGWSNPIQNVYTTSDGRDILVAVQNIARDYPLLLEVLGKTEWLQDETMQPVRPLFKNRFKAREHLSEAFAEIDSESLCASLDALGIIYSLVYKNAEVIEDQQLIDNGLIVPFESGRPGCDKTFSTPFQLTSEAQQTPRAAPEVGQHSREILSDYGLNENQIDALIEAGIVTDQ